MLNFKKQSYFLDNAVILKESLDPSVHSFVITDIEGRKKYAAVLTYYREFYSCPNEFNENEHELIPINDEEDLTEENKNYNLVYVPTAIVFITRYFYYDLLKWCLSSIHEALVAQPHELNAILESYAFELTHVFVPPSTCKRLNLCLEYDLSFSGLDLYPLDEYDFDLFGFDVSILFRVFGIEKIMKVVMFILSEQKILFVSENVGLLTPFIQVISKCFPF